MLYLKVSAVLNPKETNQPNVEDSINIEKKTDR